MDILFPPGRMVGGNIDKLFPRTEANGQPKLGKDGKPEMQCSFGYAIPKGAEQHWSQTPWGAEVYKIGQAAHPNLVASPSFSWKITDGDSQLPNKKGKKPCDQSGYPGNWVIWFSQGWLPKKCTADGAAEITAEGAIVPGYYIQVFGSVAGNKLVPNGTPGVYMNPIAVALIGEGDKIASDVDTTSLGFGAAPLPAGARPVQPAVAGFQPVAPGFPQPSANAVPGYPQNTNVAPGSAPSVTPSPSSPAQQVVPNPAILQVGAPPAAPQMTAKAAGASYQQFRDAGWSDAQMREQGYLS